MNPDDFLKSLTPTAEQDQGLAGVRTMASLIGAFYTGLLAEMVDQADAVDMTLEFMRCSIGDHKPSV